MRHLSIETSADGIATLTLDNADEAMNLVSESWLAEMVAAIYRDTDPRLHQAAGLSVLAHLEDLVARGQASAEGDVAYDGVFMAS